jgi:hypothetical protein
VEIINNGDQWARRRCFYDDDQPGTGKISARAARIITLRPSADSACSPTLSRSRTSRAVNG